MLHVVLNNVHDINYMYNDCDIDNGSCFLNVVRPNCVTCNLSKICTVSIYLVIAQKVFIQTTQKYTFLESIYSEDCKSAKFGWILGAGQILYRVKQKK